MHWIQGDAEHDPNLWFLAMDGDEIVGMSLCQHRTAEDPGMAYVDTLGVRHEMASTPAMNEIFADSLRRFSNVCNGCFKTIYTLAIKRARVLALLPFIALVLWFSLPFVQQSWILGEVSQAPGGLPYRWLIKAMLPAGFLLLLLAALSRLSRVWAYLFGDRA